MNRYTIYCTPDQTKKALELGAPIEILINHSVDKEICDKYHFLVIDGIFYINPTAEQLIGWLEEQYLYITIRYTNDVAKYWQADIDLANCIDPECGKYLVDYNFPSRKKATIAAIDAALEYLSSKQ